MDEDKVDGMPVSAKQEQQFVSDAVLAVAEPPTQILLTRRCYPALPHDVKLLNRSPSTTCWICEQQRPLAQR